MYISINQGNGWGTSGGVFDCIVESTREMFPASQLDCMKEIYNSLDEEGQSFIVLGDVGASCFNVFYAHCKKAMEQFPESERGRSVPFSHIPGILWNWSEVLRLMREDPRYSEKSLGNI
ncbi:hypothetical protein ACM9XD_06205 [Xanthomonas sacchari]|uniref:hypothetical protein n=1 Tax=Xanthomonas TaxID=338 RepID=UPI0011E7FB56|nr:MULTISPECIES: hypothetical protein [Xanthomonas]MDQ7760260.1 hypothetical protein [Xanthomonas sontii]UYK72712.1 hypothetical protein NG828_21445 [Xanthomonas sacchari]UZK08969.1 hypothetical protein CJ027_020910 [Xanthomonas sontii]